jgi:hypothetical protein
MSDHPNKGNTHATKPPQLVRTETFTQRCTVGEKEGYEALKAEFDEGRKGKSNEVNNFNIHHDELI